MPVADGELELGTTLAPGPEAKELEAEELGADDAGGRPAPEGPARAGGTWLPSAVPGTHPLSALSPVVLQLFGGEHGWRRHVSCQKRGTGERDGGETTQPATALALHQPSTSARGLTACPPELGFKP